MAEFPKDPAAVLDYAVDWAAWLALGDTLSTSTWVIAPSGSLIQTTPAPSISGAKTIIWLSGGTAGQSYLVTNHVVTTGGRTDERSFTITAVER